MEFQSFLNSTKKIIEIKCFYFFDVLLVAFILFLLGLMFHSFILSLCSNTLTLESIFEYIRQKLIKNMLILKFHPGMKCLHVFFSFFHPAMKFYPCLSSWDEISYRQGWFHPATSFIPWWNFTCKHLLNFIPGWNSTRFIQGWNSRVNRSFFIPV